MRTQVPRVDKGWCILLATAAAAAALLAPSGARALAAPGDLDPSFGTGGKVTTDFGATNDHASALVLQPDGKLVAAGGARGYPSEYDFGLARYNPDGSVDGTFGSGGKVTTDFGGADVAGALVRQADGKLVAAGAAGTASGSSFGLARYHPDGSLDRTFGAGGKVTTPFAGYDQALAVIVQPDGKLVAAGAMSAEPVASNFALARYNADGSLDATFGVGGKVVTDFGGDYDVAAALAIQPDGKLVAAGRGGTAFDFAVARYNANGSLDASFGTGGKVTTSILGSDEARDLVLQPDGKLVAAGSTGTGLAAPDFALVRYLPNGSLDPTFGFFGVVTTDFGGSDRAAALQLQPDGKLVAAGTAAGNIFATGDFGLVRYTTSGGLDPTFGSGGKATTDFGNTDGAAALVIQPDGRLVAAGRAAPGSSDDFALARYLVTEETCLVNTLAASTPAEGAAIVAGDTSGAIAPAPTQRSSRLDPARFRELRDDVLARSQGGQRYIALYNTHSPEVVRLMATDPALRTATLNGLLIWQNDVAALANGRGGSVTITDEQVRAVETVLDRLEALGSPELRRVIRHERQMHPPTRFKGAKLDRALTEVTGSAKR